MAEVMTAAEMIVERRLKKIALAKLQEEVKWVKSQIDSIEMMMDGRALDLCLPFDAEEATDRCALQEKSAVHSSKNDRVQEMVAIEVAKWTEQQAQAEQRRIEREEEQARADEQRRIQAEERKAKAKERKSKAFEIVG